MKELFFLKGKNGQLRVYEDKIVITRKGFLSFISHGFSGEKSLPITSIRSVQYKKGGLFTNGFIQFGIAGGIERQGGLLNSVDDENSVIIKRGSQSQTALKIKEYIEGRIIELSKPQANTTVVNQAISAADEILKYKQLLDSGIISQEEFDSKKKALLGL